MVPSLRDYLGEIMPNPMPESVTDRPTKAHEQVFLLTKAPRYFYDADAVREPHAAKTLTHRGGGRAGGHADHQDANGKVASGNWGEWDKPRVVDPAGRNLRTVWDIATQPYPEAHFATFPEKLVERCLLAGCPARVCRECGKPSERIVDVSYERAHGGTTGRAKDLREPLGRQDGTGFAGKPVLNKLVDTVGFTDCGHNNWRPGTVLDPFIGSGTTAHVARKHGYRAIGIELNADYCALAARRLQQLSLLAEGAA